MVVATLNILTTGFTAFYVIAVLFLRRGWIRLPINKVFCKLPGTSVTVVIAARNEEMNIGATIQDVLDQDYPPGLLEVIIVNDHSTDSTGGVVRSFENRGVRLIEFKESQPLNSYKKKALSKAIAEASGELIVATDADCRMGREWLKAMVGEYEERGLLLVSGPVAFNKERNLFERLQTLEFLYLIGLGGASIGNGKPSTCNGANLAYRRDVFYELGGFSGIDDLASGDDELFLHKVAEKYPERIGFCKNRNAIVTTQAKETLQSFISQRKRWASKSTRYKNKWVVFLGVSIWLFNVLLASSLLVAFTGFETWNVFIGCFLAKMAVEFLFLQPVCRFANRSSYLKLLPFLSVLHVLYLIYIGVAGNSGKYQWKGRRVR